MISELEHIVQMVELRLSATVDRLHHADNYLDRIDKEIQAGEWLPQDHPALRKLHLLAQSCRRTADALELRANALTKRVPQREAAE